MLRSKTALVLGVLFALAAAVPPAVAQNRDDGGWGPGSRYQRLYDPETVETIAGTVLRIDRYTPEGATAGGIHLVLETEDGRIAVHLGPQWYFERQDFALAAGDRIEATGSRVTYEGAPAILAASMRKGSDVLELRDEDGSPRWAGRRGRGWGRGGCRGSGGFGPGSAFHRLYDPARAERITGRISAIDIHVPRNATGSGIHLVLETGDETIRVFLGPAWYLERQDLDLRPDDVVEVLGSRIEDDGSPAFLAASVRRGDEVLVLRDEQGFPRWTGWRARRTPDRDGDAPPFPAGDEPTFDPETLTTISGQVVSLGLTPSRRTGRSGVHLVLQTRDERIPIHLGPEWYLSNQELRIEPGDEIEIDGSMITFEGKPAVVAARVRKNDHVLELRDDDGFPRWAGWRRENLR